MKMTVVMVMMVTEGEETWGPEGEVTFQTTLVVDGRVWVRTWTPVLSPSFFQYTIMFLRQKGSGGEGQAWPTVEEVVGTAQRKPGHPALRILGPNVGV